MAEAVLSLPSSGLSTFLVLPRVSDGAGMLCVSGALVTRPLPHWAAWAAAGLVFMILRPEPVLLTRAELSDPVGTDARMCI